MKIQKLQIFAFAALLGLSSCMGVKSAYIKDIKNMPLRFAPLGRNDYSLVGNLEVEVTVTGKGTSKGKKLDKKFAVDYKKGVGYKEGVTGSLYSSAIFNSANATPEPTGLIAKLRSKAGKLKVAADPAKDFAYFALIEKYPNVDYFVNVRFDRKIVYDKKGTFAETIVVKADGIQLKTDN